MSPVFHECGTELRSRKSTWGSNRAQATPLTPPSSLAPSKLEMQPSWVASLTSRLPLPLYPATWTLPPMNERTQWNASTHMLICLQHHLMCPASKFGRKAAAWLAIHSKSSITTSTQSTVYLLRRYFCDLWGRCALTEYSVLFHKSFLLIYGKQKNKKA